MKGEACRRQALLTILRGQRLNQPLIQVTLAYLLAPLPATIRPSFAASPIFITSSAGGRGMLSSPQNKEIHLLEKAEEGETILTNTSCLANARRRSIEALSLGCSAGSLLPRRLSLSCSSRSNVWSFLPAPLPCMVTKNFFKQILLLSSGHFEAWYCVGSPSSYRKLINKFWLRRIPPYTTPHWALIAVRQVLIVSMIAATPDCPKLACINLRRKASKIAVCTKVDL